MNHLWNRREVLKRLAAASAAFILPARAAGKLSQRPGVPDDIEIQVASISEYTLRLTILPAKSAYPNSIPFNGSLVRTAWDPPIAKLHGGAQAQTFKLGSITLKFSPDPIAFTIATASGETVQTLTWDRESGAVGFTSGNFTALGARRRWTTIRPPRFHRSHDFWPGWLQAPYPRRPSADPLDHRHLRMGAVF